MFLYDENDGLIRFSENTDGLISEAGKVAGPQRNDQPEFDQDC